MPTPWIAPRTGLPPTVIRPLLGSSRPVTSFIRVDLPQPDGPTTATNSPSWKSRVRSWTARVSSSAWRARKRDVEGKSVAGRIELGCGRIIKKKETKDMHDKQLQKSYKNKP